MKKAKQMYKLKEQRFGKTYYDFWGNKISPWRQLICKHVWEFDGQTMMSVRHTCRRCHKTELW